MGANLVLESYSGALAEFAASSKSGLETEEHFSTFDDLERDIESFIQKARSSSILKEGSPDEVFNFLAWQPHMPPANRLTTERRRRFYPVFSDTSRDPNDPEPYITTEGMSLPSIAIHFSAGEGMVRANATRRSKSEILLPARVIKRLGDERATCALEAGIDACVVEHTLTEYQRAPTLALSDKTNADLHVVRAAMVGLIHDEERERAYPNYDAGILYDLAQTPSLLSLVESAVTSAPKSESPDIEKRIAARSLLFVTSALDSYEVKDFETYATGAQVFATFENTPGAKTFVFVGILSRAVELQVRPGTPRKRGYLITGPDSIREVETKNYLPPDR